MLDELWFVWRIASTAVGSAVLTWYVLWLLGEAGRGVVRALRGWWSGRQARSSMLPFN